MSSEMPKEVPDAINRWLNEWLVFINELICWLVMVYFYRPAPMHHTIQQHQFIVLLKSLLTIDVSTKIWMFCACNFVIRLCAYGSSILQCFAKYKNKSIKLHLIMISNIYIKRRESTKKEDKQTNHKNVRSLPHSHHIIYGRQSSEKIFLAWRCVSPSYLFI